MVHSRPKRKEEESQREREWRAPRVKIPSKDGSIIKTSSPSFGVSKPGEVKTYCLPRCYFSVPNKANTMTFIDSKVFQKYKRGNFNVIKKSHEEELQDRVTCNLAIHLNPQRDEECNISCEEVDRQQFNSISNLQRRLL